jgi:hypothetical protein
MKVSELARQLNIKEVDIRIMLDEANVPNAQRLENLTQQQVDIIRNSLQAVVEGKSASALTESKQSQPVKRGSKASQTLSQQQEEARRLSTAVYEVAQELDLKDALIAGVQQGEQEALAFEFGRAQTLKAHAVKRIQDSQAQLAQRSNFDPTAQLREMGLEFPNESMAELQQASATVLTQYNDLIASYGLK